MKIKNIIKRHLNKTLDIESVAFGVTYRCNSRCTMCNIWKTHKNESELSPQEIKNIFSNKLFDNVKGITVTGGEPFIRTDLVELIESVGHKDARMIILSNGLMQNIPDIVDRIERKVSIGISLDGIGEMHDKIRGIKGAYEKATKTIEELIKKKYNLVIGFTASGINDSHIIPVRDYAEKIGANFALQVAHIAPGYFKNGEKRFQHNRQNLESILNSLKKGKSPQEKLYYDSCIRYLNGRNKDILCYSGYNSLYIEPNGNVLRCIVGSIPFGNLRENNIEEIWNSNASWNIRNRKCNCVLGCEFGNSSQYNLSLIKYKIGVAR